jgi:hypothetical protein
MLVLDSILKSITVAMSGAAATTNPDFVTAYSDDTGSAFTEGSSDGALNGTTQVTLVSAPAALTKRLIKSIFIQNKDTAAVTITVTLNNNGTLRNLAKVTLQVGDTWSTDGVTDINGNFKGLGVSGFSGFSGISGYSGYSGYSGIGTSGYSGISGYSGYSGISGYSGVAIMVYPGAGIANSTGTAWGTSYTTTGSGTVVALATNPTFANIQTNSFTSTTPVLSFNASNSPIAAGATVSGSYLQFIMQNKSATANASTNYVLSNDSGTDSSFYGEFGMNSSVFSTSTPSDFFSINNNIYFSGHDGDITVGSGNGFKTYIAWGTTGQSAHVVNATGALGFSTNLGTTPALSGTTGFGTSGQTVLSGGSSAAPSWGILTGTGGGTGVNNGSNTITIAGNLSHSGAFTQSFVATANTAVTLPAGSTASANNLLSSATAVAIVTGTPSSTTYLRGDGTWATISSGVSLSAANTWTATQTFNGSSSTFGEVLLNAAETTTVSATAATGTINYYINSQSVLYYTTNASANWTLNVAFSSGTSLNTAMSTGQTVTLAFLVAQGSTAYYENVFQIDGTTVTPKWQGGTAPTSGNASGIDVYTYTILKTASATYTVLASLTQFK